MNDLHSCTLALLLILALGCESDSPYERMRKQELARTDTLRDLFLSYELGMTQEAFFDSSWALNRRGLVMQGPQNQNVQLKLPNALPFPGTMLFYPDFDEGRVIRMRLRFGYDHWAPWNRRLHADSLLLDVKELMAQWYQSGEFFERSIVTLRGGSATELVTLHANREIALGRYSDQEVYVVITDLRALPEMPR